jgi:hypothetical protein
MQLELRKPAKGNSAGPADGAGGRIVFEAAWSGESFGNSATAVATFTLDTRWLGSPGDYVAGVGHWLTDIELTVSGARVGNGRFTTPDFEGALFHCSGALDFTRPLLEQSGFLDFNLFGGHGSPEGSHDRELTLPGDPGESLVLTRLAAAAAGKPSGKGVLTSR